MRLARTLLPSVLLLSVFAPSFAQTATPTYGDVVYATVEGVPMRLDLYVPEGPGPFPLVVWIHGGGWVEGDKTLDEDMVLPFLERGMALASLEYRLTLDARFDERTFPAQIHDVKGAVRFLRAGSAAYRLDPSRVVAWGASAGGHLAALMGTSGGVADLEGDVGGNLEYSSRVLAVVDYFGPADMKTFAVQDPWVAVPMGPLSLLIGHSMVDLLAHWDDPAPPYPQLRALAESAGPVNHVDHSDPPFFIAHGDADDVVSVLQSDELAAALDAAGVPCEYHRVPGAGHDGAGMPAEETLAFFEAAFARPALTADFSHAPASPTDATPVTFTAAAAGGAAPYAYAWDLCGRGESGENVTRQLPPGSCEVTLTVTDASGATATARKALAVGYSIAVTGAVWASNPGRLKVSGTGFEVGCVVRAGGADAPQTVFKDPGLLVAKGSGLKAMLPKGTVVPITVAAADGRSSAPFPFTR